MQLVSADPPLLFLHIRKTAGCSVRNWLRNRFHVQECLLECHTVANRAVDPSPYQFVTGHVGFDYRERFTRRPICFVVLRDPVERALSAFYFFQRHDARYLRWLQDTLPRQEAEDRVRFTQRANELPLVEFLEREPTVARKLLGDVQTRCLLSRPGPEPRPEGEMLDEARRNLESCEVVGLTERLGATLSRLAGYMGWEDDSDAIPHDNPTAGRPGVGEIPPRARAILADWNRLDLELYQTAERLSETQQLSLHSKRAPLPPATDFTFDQAVPGCGWYAREQGDRGWFCWLGREAWLDLKLEEASEHRLEIHIAHVLRPESLDGLQVRVNGQLVATRFQGDGARIIEAAIPAVIVGANPGCVRVTFTMGEAVRPCDLVPGNPDTRVLGVALERVRLLPLRRVA